jgi:hypothetical protein
MALQVACLFTTDFTTDFASGGSLDRSLNSKLTVSDADEVAQQYAAAAARVRELEDAAGALQAGAVAALEEEERHKVPQQRPKY